MPRWVGEEEPHDLLGIAIEITDLAGHERAIGHVPVERITDEGELEEARELLWLHVRLELGECDVPVPDASELGDRERTFDEEANLLQVIRSHVLAKGSAHRMRPGFRDRREDE